MKRKNNGPSLEKRVSRGGSLATLGGVMTVLAFVVSLVGFAPQLVIDKVHKRSQVINHTAKPIIRNIGRLDARDVRTYVWVHRLMYSGTAIEKLALLDDNHGSWDIAGVRKRASRCRAVSSVAPSAFAPRMP